jgi:cytochrome c-type biogenesis protein
MSEAELALALGAGMLAAVNPCGFALLPAYLSLLVLGDGSAEPVEARMQSRSAAVVRALVLTAAMTAGFVAVFGIFGLVISPIASGIQRYLPWVTSSVLEGIALFIAYALGMSVLVGTAAVAVALAESSLISQLRRVGRFVPTMAGSLMILVGGYVGYYGWWEIRVLRGGRTDDPVITAAAAIQRAVANGVATVGAGWLAVILLIALGVVAVIGLRRLRLRRRQEV